MRDLTKSGFNSNTPMKNYIVLLEKIESLQTRIRKLEDSVLELNILKNNN